MFHRTATTHGQGQVHTVTPISSPDAVNCLCTGDGSLLDGSEVFVDLSAATSDLPDCTFPQLDDYSHHNPNWPMLSPLSTILHTHPTDPSLASTQLSSMLSDAPPPEATPRHSSTSHRPENAAPLKPPAGAPRTIARGSQRRHYEVEKRYRSTLNGKYAELGRALSSESTRRICSTDSREWAAHLESLGDAGDGSRSSDEPAGGVGGNSARRGKTATLSLTMETIRILERCCRQKAASTAALRSSVHELRGRVTQILDQGAPLGPAQPHQ